MKDPATLEHVSRLAGDSEITRHSTTTDPTGRRSTTEASQYRRLAPDHALRSMHDGQGLLIYGSTPPTLLSLRPWYQDAALRRRATTGVP